MERQILIDHLALAEKHVAQGEQHLARQRKVLETLARDGHDTATAADLLRTLEATQALHRAERDRLRAELRATK